jgi:hypothetical protein
MKNYEIDLHGGHNVFVDIYQPEQYHGEFSRGEWNIERHHANEDE